MSEAPPIASIHVCALNVLELTVSRIAPGHLVSLINAEMMREIVTPPSILRERHLRLIMNDITAPAPGLIAPNQAHVEQLTDFALGWDRQTPLLVHCHAGVSRSTAAAYAALCALNPETDETIIARAIRQASPTARPNWLLVSLADQVLARQGRMLAALEALGEAERELTPEPFALSAQFQTTLASSRPLT